MKKIYTTINKKGSLNDISKEELLKIEDTTFKSTTGDYIPLTGTEEGKPVTGHIGGVGYEAGFGVVTNEIDGGSLSMFCYNESDVMIEISSNQTDYIRLYHENSVGQEGQEGQEVIRIPYKSGIMLLNDSISYSTDEIKTGGTWIDGKPIYTITKLTTDPIPADIGTRFPDEIIGTYTTYKYTKTTD